MLKTSTHSFSITELICAFLLLLSSAATWAATYSVLHDFGSGQDAVFPSGALARDTSGNLYGTSYQGGETNEGAVYELSPNNDGTWAETIVHGFTYNDGDVPYSGVIVGSDGNLYGATTNGGPGGGGTVFELAPGGNTWTFSLLYSLGSNTALILDKAGNLYGALGPGDYGAGAVSELTPGEGGWTYTSLHSFCPNAPQCWDGEGPVAVSAWDVAGNLYGTTLYGGNQRPKCADGFGCGVVFRMKPTPDGAWTYRVLHRFASFSGDGQIPNGIIVDKSGNAYGTTIYGGPNFYNGTIFQLSPHPPGQWGPSAGYLETQLYTFPDCAKGCSPFGSLARDKAGNLYGVAGGGNTSCGGFYCGAVYRLAPQPDGTWKYSVLHKFSGPDGEGPNGVTVAPDGTLYGTTIAGGQYNRGVAFAITP